MRILYGVRPKNYLKPGVKEKYPENLDLKKMQFWHHITASEIKESIPEEIWNKSLKITVERHPYEKAISMAWYNFPRQDRFSTFSKWLDDVVDVGYYENWSIYSINDNNIADVIIRYENLLEDTNKTLGQLGLPTVKKLPAAKRDYRKDARPALEILSSYHKKRIQEVCAKEFEYFGYAY